jgi:signal transduction histidine kinase/ligand-binding sensor domain-containing protein
VSPEAGIVVVAWECSLHRRPLRPGTRARCWSCPSALVLLLALAASPLSANQFRSIGDNRGVDAEVVSTLLFDDRGLLWVGTREGLLRYDGYSALRYQPDSGAISGLSDADIRKLYQAPDGTLWIATNTGGLNRLDRDARMFRHYRHDPGDPGSLSNDSVYDMVSDGEDGLWVATQRGLNLLDTRSGVVQRFGAARGDGGDSATGALSNDYIYQLLRTADGDLWIATVGGGLNLLSASDQRLTHHSLSQVSGIVEHDDVFAMVTGETGSLWLGTRGGLLHYWPARGVVEQIDLGDNGQQPTVTSLIRGPGDSLLLGTMGRGVLRYEPGSGRWFPLHAAPLGSPGQLPPLPQLSLARSGNLLFVGTWGGGLFSTRLGEPDFELLGIREGQPQLRNGNVSALYHDGERLLVGSFGGGLQALESPDGGLFNPFPPPLDLSGEALLSLQPGDEDHLYAGSTSGLWYLEPESGRATLQQHDPQREDSLGEGYVTALALDAEDSLWVGTGGSGLYALANPAAGTFKAFRADPGDADAIAGNYISALLQLPGELWVGTRSQGLSRCRLPRLRCLALPDEIASTTALGSGLISHLLRGRDASVWVATGSAGLYQLNRGPDGELRVEAHYGIAQGLLSEGIMSIAEDDDGSLWLASREGLSRLQPATGVVVNYPETAGIPVVHFNTGVAAAGPGHLYFGTPRGLLALPRGTPFAPRSAHRTRITSLETTAADTGAGLPLRGLDRIAVAYGEVVSLGFAVLDYAEKPHQYQYRMRDDQPWISLGDRHQISFYNLAPGSYQFSVRGRDIFGAWSEADAIDLRIIPPFWRTLWFQALALLALLSVLFLMHRLRLRRLHQHNTQLSLLERQRHRALLREQRSRSHLEQAYLGLQNLTHRLETAKEEERQEISRELHDELGQSLTATKINLQLLQQQSVAEPASPGGVDPQRLADSIAIIDNMIAQVRSVSLSLRPPLLDEAGLVAALQDYVEQVRQRSELAIELSCDEAVDELAGDRAILVFRIIQESVNNILRHAEASRAEIRVQRKSDQLLISIRDDGRGFHVREVNQRIERGEHLGLLGIRERARSAGGRVKISSRPGEGCRLEIRIPW